MCRKRETKSICCSQPNGICVPLTTHIDELLLFCSIITFYVESLKVKFSKKVGLSFFLVFDRFCTIFV